MHMRYMENMHGGFHKVHLAGIPEAPIAHTFTTPDSGDPHDHPFDLHSVVLAGGYTEECYDRETGAFELVTRQVGEAFLVEARRIHRIVALDGPVCVTLSTYAPSSNPDWGFYRWEGGRRLWRAWDSDVFREIAP